MSTSSRMVFVAVAGHAGRHALGDGCELAADDETAIVAAGDVRLDDHVPRPALAQCLGIRPTDGCLVAQVEGDAAPVVAIERLDHARIAQASRGRDRLILGADHLGTRDGQAGRVQEPVGELLVGRDVDRDPARAAGHRGPDALLVDALAQAGQGCSGQGA